MSGHVGWAYSVTDRRVMELAERAACMGVIVDDAESAKRKSPAVARRDLGESRARPAVLAIANDMAAAQAYGAEVST